MLKEKDLPSVQEIRKMSKESDGAYETAVNNIIIGIKETTETGRYEYIYWNKLPKSFSTRLSKWLTGLGYEVQFRDFEKSGDKNSLGWDIELMEVFIRWH
jgi:predicted transcriptional regulator